MSYTVEYYQSLVTSEHQNSPKYMAWLGAMIEPLTVIQSVIENLINDFDVDTAVGKQLDIVGQWVGISRILKEELIGVYFTWDVDDLGWDSGVWQSPDDPDSGLIVLPDDIYRTLIKAKIVHNHWNGSINGLYDIWDVVFGNNPDAPVLIIQDNQDMSMDYIFSVNVLGIVEQELAMTGQYFIKPEGVLIREVSVVPSSGPAFFWDVDDTAVTAGWDVGQWVELIN